jgi:hypothetical protein
MAMKQILVLLLIASLINCSSSSKSNKDVNKDLDDYSKIPSEGNYQ